MLHFIHLSMVYIFALWMEHQTYTSADTSQWMFASVRTVRGHQHTVRERWTSGCPHPFSAVRERSHPFSHPIAIRSWSDHASRINVRTALLYQREVRCDSSREFTSGLPTINSIAPSTCARN